MYLKSKNRPSLPPPQISLRMCNFEIQLRRLFSHHPRIKSNLSKFQHRILQRLKHNGTTVFAIADKNLGPVAILLIKYIEDGLIHLKNEKTYLILSEAQALAEDCTLREEIRAWICKYARALPNSVRAYLRSKLKETKDDPFGYFYLLYKLHKNPVSTRPVCSDCAATPHALGQWVDEMLQPIVKAQDAYFKDTFELKGELDKRGVGWMYSLLTCDAVSMYTNIDTEDCISRLSTFLLDAETQAKFPHYNPKALIAAIKIVMRNNRMKFGDIYARQLIGIAMGMSPAPTIANLYVAIHERAKIIGKFDSLSYYRRFIDDGFAIWKHHPDPDIDAANYKSFQDAIRGGGLDWTFTKRAKQVDFMDLTITIEDNKLSTNLFQKPLALHLFIPPHSCHPKKCFKGLVTGMTLRIHRLCSHQRDIDHWTKQFYTHLLDRGYHREVIVPLLNSAIESSTAYLATSEAYRQLQKEKKAGGNNKVFFKLKYHTFDPDSSIIQQLWRDCVVQPPGMPHLTSLCNSLGENIRTDRLCIAYSRYHNIGNLLSYRKICNRPGPKVSSLL